jgi:hypothetical protein
MRAVIILALLLTLSAVLASANPTDGTTLDVLVLYTPLGRAQLGGTDARLIQRVTTAFNLANRRLTEANAAPRLRWVGLQPTFYQEQVNLDFHADLTNLMTPNDGLLDDAHALREVAQADLVILLAGTQFALYRTDTPAWAGTDPARGFGVLEGRYFTGETLLEAVGRLLGASGTDPTLELGALTLNAPLVAQYRASANAPSGFHAPLLLNGGFEDDTDNNGTPEFWRLVSPQAEEGRWCAPNALPNQGACALRWRGIVNSPSVALQRINGSGMGTGDILHLSGQFRTLARAPFGSTVIVRAHYPDGTSQEARIELGRSIGAYRAFATSLVLRASPRRIVVEVRSTRAGAFSATWLDDLSLTRVPAY